jgi:hypothetical protein
VQGIRICDCFSIATGRGGLAGHFRQTEVEYLGVAAPRYENISRFDVSMHDALAVSRVESLRDVNRDGEELFRFNWTTRDEGLSVRPSRNSMTIKARPSCSPMS